MREIPPIAIAFGDYTTCNLSDPECTRISNMLENQASSQYPDVALQQQLNAVRGLLNQVDVSYVRFKNPSATSSQPSFEYAFTPQPSIPQKRSFKQVMEMTPQDARENASMHVEFHQNTYQVSNLSPQLQSDRFQGSVSESLINNSIPQTAYHQDAYKKPCIVSNSDSSFNMKCDYTKEQQNESQQNIYNNSEPLFTSDNQALHRSSPTVFAEIPTIVEQHQYSNVSPPGNTYQISQNSSNIHPPSPKVIVENTLPIMKSNLNPHIEHSSIPPTSLSPQLLNNRPPSPKVVIYNDKPPVIDDNHRRKNPKISSMSMQNNYRPASPEVVIEVPPRDILAEYRSYHETKKQKEKDRTREKEKDKTREKEKHREKERDRDDERNGENSLNKFVSYISAIFDAEDSVTSELPLSNDQLSLFIPSSISSNEPLLTSEVVHQIIRLVNKVCRYNRLEDADVDDLGRLLKILERSVREVETLDLFPRDYKTSSKSNSRSKNKVSDTMSLMSLDDDSMDEDDKCFDSHLQKFEEKLGKIINGIEAATAAFTIMTGGNLSKQLYPEDLITSSLNLVKNQLVGVIYRIFEMNILEDALNNDADSALIEMLEHSHLKRQTAGMLPIITNYLRKLYDLIQKEELSDSIVITVSYIAIGPFFVDSANNSGNSIFGNGLEAVKLVALGLLRTIFTNYQKQRTWILEEILTSLIKLPTTKRNLRQYRLPDGKSIQMVSALILQLIQSCTVGITHFGLKSVDDQPGEQLVENLTSGAPNDLKKCSSAWKTGIDSASSNAGCVFKFLLSRCTKSIKNSNESEYRVLLDNFMEDVITVLNYPEWPAAEMIVRIFSKIMIGYMNDKKADNYTKSMAIDYLGIIAGRIKKFANTGLISGEDLSEENGEDNDDDDQNWIDKIKDIPKGDITIQTTTRAIKNLHKCQKAVLTFLEFGAMEDPGVQCARQFYLAEWGYSLSNTLLSFTEKQSNLRLEDKDKASLISITKLMNKFVAEYWQMSSEDQIVQSLEHRTQEVERTDVHLITELMATRQALYQNFDSILSRILISLDTGVVAFRTKALRALGQVVVCDPNILSQVNVRQTIAQRFSDNSPAVRDAAIELVGRYLAQKPEITEQYYKVISDRVLDTGLNVRKRVIKLLRDIYLKSSDQEMKIDIGCKILIRINDDDDHVKDLALKTIQELWFSPFKHQKNFSSEMCDIEDDDKWQNEFNNMPASGKKDVLGRSLLIVGVAGRLGERNGHIMGGLFKKILDKDGKQKREILSICQCIVDCLFEHLLTLQDSNSKTEVVSCISTICLLSNASPLLVRKHVTTLQPYLKSSSTSDDQSILYYVLIIYRNVLPLLKRPNPNFLSEVEQTLMSLLTKSPQKILQEVLPCLCVIVDKLTHNYTRLTKLLRSCTEKLKLEQRQLEAGKEISSARNVMVLLLIVGLLCKNFDFDKKRLEKPNEMKELDIIDKGPIVAITFQLVLYFCKKDLSETVQKMALQSLGFIYLSYPIIMLRPESTDLMDRILNNGVMDMKIQLMKVFLDFLVSEQQKINMDLEDKKKKKNNPVDLKVLIGNADEFAEAGVSSSLMQRYLDRILECTFDHTQSLKIVALDVLGNIIQQGLAHPVLCIPTIVAMETSPEQNIRDKSFKLHQHLNEKHASLIHSRNVDCVKKAYAFQKQLLAGGNPIVGYAIRSHEGRPEALLNPMYSLLKDKRKSRTDFLVSVVKTFDFDLKKCDESKVDVGFCKFVAENLATIDYKTIEEVLHVIYLINRVLSVVAISVLHSVQNNIQETFVDNVRVYIENKIPENFIEEAISQPNESFSDAIGTMEALSISSPMVIENETQQSDSMEVQFNDKSVQDNLSIEKENILPLLYAAKVSVCMAILMYLKEHLKKSFALSEAKCQNFNPTQHGGTHKDKPALRHQNAPLVISWDGLPFVDKPLVLENDIWKQCELFKKLMAEDGTRDSDDFC
ncbi:ARM repeat-containing protein [Gigaspora margarita]|uniref:Sister chromatid cohesion protein n=1 Tax=Gigaspora margarita TaxID=4874 RepID=A0A8H4AQC4_GIGMA|nr:ARM repeat-containing protein [Gigaspora margarita]